MNDDDGDDDDVEMTETQPVNNNFADSRQTSEQSRAAAVNDDDRPAADDEGLEQTERLLKQAKRQATNQHEPQRVDAATEVATAENDERPVADDDDEAADDETVEETARPVRQRRNKRQATEHQEQPEHVYNCTSCSRSFNSRREMVTHQYMHRENPTAFCTACNKSFSTESAYRRHAASHSRKTSATRRPRKTCSQCSMEFDTMRQLSAHHAAKHVDEKRFVCAICGSQFAWPENLRAHQRTHELDPHECEQCGRRFVDATSLRVHTRNSHGPSSSDATAQQRKPHNCQLCGRSFQFDFSLRAHMKGHAQSPMAASLRWASSTGRHHQKLSDTPRVSQTKYVHVDSEGVIDLGMHVASTSQTSQFNTEPTEIIVEVYNSENSAQQDNTQDRQQASLDNRQQTSLDNTQQASLDNSLDKTHESSLDFSDVLDSTQTQHGATDSQLDTGHTTDQTGHKDVQLDCTTDQSDQCEDSEAVRAATTSKLVWYVKPDEHRPAGVEQQTAWHGEQHQIQQRGVQPEQCSDDDDDMHDVSVMSADLSAAASDRLQHPNTDCTAAAAAAAARADDVSVELEAVVTDKAAVLSAETSQQSADNSQQQCPQQPAPVTDERVTLQPAPLAANTTLSSQRHHMSDNDNDNDDDDDGGDVIDWMDTMEPPRRRAAPAFVFRQTSRGRRAQTRPREPFLFNCVMTDEKPFVCLTCGQRFRWEISLSIHQRLHTDGTFPNKSRGSARLHRRQLDAVQQQTAESSKTTKGKSKRKNGTKTSKASREVVGRSCIVRHRRTSSDEDDDEFTFHVHADGPTQVTTRYTSLRHRRQQGTSAEQRREAQRAGIGRGQGSQGGIGRGVAIKQPTPSTRSSSASVTVRHKAPVVKPSSSTATATSGCNGVNVVQQSSVHAVKSQRRWRRLGLRACHWCRQCDRVVTQLAVFSRHQQRAHHSIACHCQLCPSQFTSRWHLRRHCQRQHCAVSGATAAQCRHCQRVFTDNTRLQLHYNLHRAAVKPSSLSA